MKMLKAYTTHCGHYHMPQKTRISIDRYYEVSLPLELHGVFPKLNKKLDCISWTQWPTYNPWEGATYTKKTFLVAYTWGCRLDITNILSHNGFQEIGKMGTFSHLYKTNCWIFLSNKPQKWVDTYQINAWSFLVGLVFVCHLCMLCILEVFSVNRDHLCPHEKLMKHVLAKLV